MIRKILFAAIVVYSVIYSFSVQAAQFTVTNIEFKGLQRVTLGAALLSLPIREGDVVDDYALSQAIKKLYKSGYFKSINLDRKGNALIFNVKERPTISSIVLTGNKKLSDKQILDSLHASSIKVGESLDRTVLSGIDKSLQNFYHSVGKYNAQVETIFTDLPRNRAAIQFIFHEGLSAKIAQINIVGNKVFSDKTLLKRLSLSSSAGWWDFFAEDQYQKQKLAGDLEVIRSYYLNRGYIRFKINDTQVSLTPNKKDVYVTVNVSEGDIYKVSGVKFFGNLLHQDKSIASLVPFKKGDVYSAANIAATEQSIRRYFGRLGYAFPKITTYPEIDDKTHTVAVNFSVVPGARGYVRDINISGNSTTKDVVLRREMRQMEGSWISSENIEQSKKRLNRLGFFSKVDINTPRVSNDLVDLDVKVEEQASGSFNASIGYGTESGIGLTAGIHQNNFLGSGDNVGISAKTNKYSKNVSFNYTTPYLTADAVSGGFSVYYYKFDAANANIVDYTTTTYGTRISTGFPVNEVNRLGFSLGWEDNEISQTDAYLQTERFWNIYYPKMKDEGTADFQNVDGTVSWIRNTLDKGRLATQGMMHSLSLKVTTPRSDLQYFKVNFNIRHYQRITDNGDWTTLLRASAGYGNGYGKFDGNDQVLPYFENYYAGGYRTLRGFASNTVGPRAIYSEENSGNKDIFVTDNAIGGNAKYTLSAAVIFPVPFIDEAYSRLVRTSLFIDAGEVWDTEFNYAAISKEDCVRNCDYLGDYSKPGRLRSSAGTQLTWVSPMGPLVFTLALPIKKYPGDKTEVFSFNIGNTF
ncbi:MAG: outer membrane protein assembly factor BamA [Psychromonas sp.]|nr:outer membrane protein assembly factor BamA [Psychromonas sp.]